MSMEELYPRLNSIKHRLLRRHSPTRTQRHTYSVDATPSHRTSRFTADPASTSPYFARTQHVNTDALKELLGELENCYEAMQQAQDRDNHDTWQLQERQTLRAELKELREANANYQTEVLALKNEKLKWLQTVDELKRQVFKKEIDYEALLREKLRLEAFTAVPNIEVLKPTLRNEPVKPDTPKKADMSKHSEFEKKAKRVNRRHSSSGDSGHVTLATANKLIREIMQELRVSSPTLILPKILSLKKNARTTQSEFIEFLREAASEHCGTPKNASLSDLQAALKQVLPEKKQPKRNLLLGKVKTLLGLSPSAEPAEVEAELTRRLRRM